MIAGRTPGRRVEHAVAGEGGVLAFDERRCMPWLVDPHFVRIITGGGRRVAGTCCIG